MRICAKEELHGGSIETKEEPGYRRTRPDPPGRAADKSSEDTKAARSLGLSVLRWVGATLTTVLAGLAVWALQQHFSHPSRTGPPVKVASQASERSDAQGDVWIFPSAIHLSDSELTDVNQRYKAARTEKDRQEWFRRRDGVDPEMSTLKIVLVGNRNHEVRITDIQAVAHCRAPLDGTIFYSPPAGGEPTIGIGFDLDTEHPVAQHFDNDEFSGRFFSDTTIGLMPDEQQVLTLYSKTLQRYCEYSLEMTVLDGTKSVISSN